jgi:hypothetical protein
MAGNRNSSTIVPTPSEGRSRVGDSYQPAIEQRTYTPVGVNGNYQPVVSPSIGVGPQPTPPTGGSGVPAGRIGSGDVGAPSGNGSSD